MPFKKGDKKPEGSGMRKGQKAHGTKAKETAHEIFVRMTGQDPIEYCMDLMKALSPRDRLRATQELLPYMRPKLAQTQVIAEVNITNNVSELLAELEKLDESGTN